MGKVEKFLTADKVLQYLEVEVKEACDKLGIFIISSRVWADENSPNDEFLGYAMQDELYSRGFTDEYNYEVQDRSVLYTEIDALMEHAYYLIGFTTLYATIDKEAWLLEERGLFWTHYNNALIVLSTASDRLREFVITYVLRHDFKKYDKKQKKDLNLQERGECFYELTFKEMSSHMGNMYQRHKLFGLVESQIPHYLQSLGDIGGAAAKVGNYRTLRNDIRHVPN